ncbi:MAG: hypothetical protein Q8L86_00200, partial [Vicinamibacterales bacterium]|nr:hypothetical protein [Vicinamibacterales bacterium]
VYVLPSGRRNEALDLRVYGYAALQSLNVRWGHLMAQQQRAAPPPPLAPPSEPIATPAPRASRLPPPPIPRARTVRRSIWMS